jgi:hypothetical protein
MSTTQGDRLARTWRFDQPESRPLPHHMYRSRPDRDAFEQVAHEHTPVTMLAESEHLPEELSVRLAWADAHLRHTT